MSGMKQSENGDELIIRVVETEGKATTTKIDLPGKIRSARRLNLIELPLEDGTAPVVKGQSLQITLGPHEIATIGIKVVK